MNLLGNMSLRTRLALPLIVLVAGIIATIGFTIHGQTRLADRTLGLSEEELPDIAQLSEVIGEMNEAFLAERSSLMMDVQSPEYARLPDQHRLALETAATGLAKLPANAPTGGDKSMAQIREAFAQWADTSRKVLEIRSKDTRSSRLMAVDLSEGESRKQFNDFNVVIGKLTDSQLKTASSNVRESLADSRMNLTMVTILGSIITLFGAFVAWLLPAAVSRRLNNIQQRVDAIANGDGDLTRRLDIPGSDEISRIGKSFDQFSASLHDTISQAKRAAQSVAASSREISGGNQSMADRTENVAANVLQASSRLAQVSELITGSSDNALQARESAFATRDLARAGGDVIRRAVTAMSEISESSQRIGDIIGVVDSIAFQTNILALNAAVEAARAGEQGRGFAVVASEVRGLAQRSAVAANEIKELIRNASEKVALGTELVNASGDTLNRIMESVVNVTTTIEDISSASQQQSHGIQEINATVSEIGDTMQANTAFVEEVAASSTQMDQCSSELLKLISRFKVHDDMNAGGR